MFPLLRYLIGDLIDDRGRSLLTILGLTALVMSTLVITSIAQAMQSSAGSILGTSHNLLITSAGVLDPMESSLEPSLLDQAADVVRQGFGAKAVRKASPIIYRQMRIDRWYMQVMAVPLDDMPSVYSLELIEGSWPEGEDQILASQVAAKLTGWALGSRITIYGREFKVVGVVQAGGRKATSLWMTYPAGQSLFGTQRGFQIMTLQLDPNIDLVAAQKTLEASPRLAQQYDIYLEEQLTARASEGNQEVLYLAWVLELIALLVMTFGAYNFTSLTLVERGRELVILRVLGFRGRVLHWFLMLRAVLLAMAAFGLGASLTQLVLFVYEERAPLNNLTAIPLVITPARLLGTLGLVLAFSVLGAWLPALSRFQLNTGEQLRSSEG
jgi:ABC-type antimicrobial peptide transport system permease subunit